MSTEYDSLLNEMEADYRSIMVGFTAVRDGMGRVQVAMQSLHGTTRTILKHVQATDARVDVLEKRIERLEQRTPPAA